MPNTPSLLVECDDFHAMVIFAALLTWFVGSRTPVRWYCGLGKFISNSLSSLVNDVLVHTTCCVPASRHNLQQLPAVWSRRRVTPSLEL